MERTLDVLMTGQESQLTQVHDLNIILKSACFLSEMWFFSVSEMRQ